MVPLVLNSIALTVLGSRLGSRHGEPPCRRDGPVHGGPAAGALRPYPAHENHFVSIANTHLPDPPQYSASLPAQLGSPKS
jgi:hypothetical protein